MRQVERPVLIVGKIFVAGLVVLRVGCEVVRMGTCIVERSINLHKVR